MEKVCKYMRHLFPRVVSYNRFVELEKEVAVPLALFIKKGFFGFKLHLICNEKGELQRTLDTQLALF